MLSFVVIGYKSYHPIEQELNNNENDPLGLETEPEWNIKHCVGIVAITLVGTMWIINVATEMVVDDGSGDLKMYKLFLLILFCVICVIIGYLFVMCRELFEGYIIAPVRAHFVIHFGE